MKKEVCPVCGGFGHIYTDHNIGKCVRDPDNVAVCDHCKGTGWLEVGAANDAAIKYMEKQIKKHRINLAHETARNAPEEILNNIKLKISHYEAAVAALKEVARCAE